MIHGAMAEIPSTHYVKSDDVHIAYQVIGEGSFDLLFVPGFVSNVETIWQSPEQSAFFRRLASFSRLILFDKRGTGMSDRSSQIFTLEQRMHDVQAILDAVGSKRAALFGISEGGPMSLLYTATYPERTSALVLYGSYAKRSWAPDYLFGWTDEQWQAVLDDIEHNWGSPQSLSIAMRAPSLAGDPHAAQRIASYYRAAASPGAASSILRMNREIDVRNVLPATRVPTLILHRTAERVIDVGHARYMAQHIPGAKLVELRGADGPAYWEHPDSVIGAIREFVEGGAPPVAHARELLTVLFTDIVRSTERLSEVGDRDWNATLRVHNDIAESIARLESGRIVKHTGDGLVVTFGDPERAVAFARELRARLSPVGVTIRAGLHTGVVNVSAADIDGLTVHIAARGVCRRHRTVAGGRASHRARCRGF